MVMPLRSWSMKADRIGERLEPLSNIEQGNITASGLFQYAFGSDESLNLTINGSFVDDERLSSLSDLDPVILGLHQHERR